MWFNLSLENSHLYNFNINFSSLNSDILIHLTQWQYWWWFWFSLVWVLYFFLAVRVIRFRVIKMKPKIATSFRPHGKWGDFLACLIPLVWCINILTNSNLILRLIEWQNESSLFTLRVRARQWYWIYKFELKNFTDILSTPKNIGNNRWQINTFGDLQTADDYLHILQLRAQNKWVKDFWNSSLLESSKSNKAHIVTPKEQLRINLYQQYKTFKTKAILNKFNVFNDNPFFYKNIKGVNVDLFFSKNQFINYSINLKSLPVSANLCKNTYLNIYNNTLAAFFFKKNFNKFTRFEDFDEYSRFFKKNYSGKLPIKIVKIPLTLENSNLNFFYKFRFNSNSNFLQHKLPQDNMYFTLKQKRYNRKKIILPQTLSLTNGTYINSPYLTNSGLLKKSTYNQTSQYNLIKKNRKRNELFSVISNKRLLRTKKILVLPSHVNITIITNSYDIIHSWFIPSLGLKLDCVPGRSTHHTFYVDNVGFYYGQCAEICGRYHHHMPIKLCAVPFEHFLLWWNNFGLPKLFNINLKKNNQEFEIRKYTW